MDGHPPHGQGPRGVSEPGGDIADGTAPAEDTGQEVEIHLRGGGKGEGVILDDGVLYQVVAEYSSTVHLYDIPVRPVQGVGKGSRGASRDAVVITVRK